MSGFKYWVNWLHPIATVMGAWGGFPKPPQVFLNLTKFELFRWFLVFILAYQGGAGQDIKIALMVTVSLYLITKLFELRDVTSELQSVSKTSVQQEIQREESAAVQVAQLAAREAAAKAAAEATAQVAQNAEKSETFFGGYYM